MVLMMTIFVFLTPSFRTGNDHFSYIFYGIYFTLNLINSIIGYVFFVSIGSFQARITDKTIGGTYMTFLALFLNLGGNFWRTVVLYSINLFTVRSCEYNPNSVALNSTLASILNNTVYKSARLANKCSKNTDIQV